MPLFERQYAAVGRDGSFVPVPPAVVLARFGPTLQVVISVTPQHADALAAKGEQPPKPLLGHALIDTGASITAVDEDVCRKLGLFSTGVVKMKHAGGADSRMCYPVQISFPGTPLPQFSNPRAVSCALGGPHILLFGRDLLASLRFVYNGPAGRIEVAF